MNKITNDNTKSSYFKIDINRIKKDAQQGQLDGINLFIRAFKLPGQHQFLAEEPKLAAKFAGFLLKKLNKEKIQLPKDVVWKLVEQFQTCAVFPRSKFNETVIITCSDGNVSLNKHLICYASDYFKRMISSNMKEQKNVNGAHSIDFSEHCHVVSVMMLKRWLYSGNLPSRRVELHNLVEVLNLSKLACIDEAYNYFKNFSIEVLKKLNLKEKNEDYFHLVYALTQIDKDFIPYFIQCAGPYFDLKIGKSLKSYGIAYFAA